MNAGKLQTGEMLIRSPYVISGNLTSRAWLEQTGTGFAVFSELEREGMLS